MKSVIFAVAGTILASGASAQLIAAENFDVPPYSAGGLNGQNPGASANSFGWDGGWVVGSANLQPSAGTLTNGATAYDDASTGKGGYIASSFDFFRRGFRDTAAYTASDTYYMSMFLNPGGSFGATGSREYAMAGFTNFFDANAFNNAAFSGDVLGLLAGFRGEDAGAAADSADLIIRARGASGDLEDTVLISDVDASTYHVIMKVDINVGGGTADDVTFWVNPFDLSDEAALTASAASTGSISTEAFADGSSIDRLNVHTSNWSRSFFYDETRFGYDLDSVTGVPAPASAALLGLGGLAAARRRRA